MFSLSAHTEKFQLVVLESVLSLYKNETESKVDLNTFETSLGKTVLFDRKIVVRVQHEFISCCNAYFVYFELLVLNYSPTVCMAYHRGCGNC